MKTIERLKRVDDELQWLLMLEDDHSVFRRTSEWMAAGLTVRTVRGAKMRTDGQLFDEFAAALQFPYYFGENWAAFTECLAEPANLDPAVGYVIVITSPEQVLVAGDKNFPSLITSIKTAHDALTESIAIGKYWDRKPVPFHVVLVPGGHVAGDVSARWSSTGVSIINCGEDD